MYSPEFSMNHCSSCVAISSLQVQICCANIGVRSTSPTDSHSPADNASCCVDIDGLVGRIGPGTQTRLDPVMLSL